MKSFTLTLATACLANLVNGQNTTSNPIVNLGYASFQGIVDSVNGVTSYYALRYAQPPVGELRFRAPQPIEGSNYYNSSVVNATAPGPMCVQSQYSV